MRKFLLALNFLALIVCVPGDYFIRISPSAEPQAYQMKLNSAVTFRVSAYKKGTQQNTLILLEDKIWWDYDKRILQKVSSDKSSTTLKAINTGTVKLTATTIIKNNRCQEAINISVVK